MVTHLLLAQEVLNCGAVVAATVSAVYWWRSSHIFQQAIPGTEGMRSSMNARAATSAAVAATMQALAVLSRLAELAHLSYLD